MLRVVIIGAGVVGASLAYRLARAGAQVTVAEAGHAGGGASSASFAWLNAANKKPQAYYALNIDGMAAHRELAAAFGGPSWLHEGGRLEWIAEPCVDSADRAFARLASWGYEGGWIGDAAAQELEPDIDLSGVAGCRPAYFPGEAWIDPAPYVRAMLAGAEQAGARTLQGAPVRGLRMASGRVAGVDLATGPLEADVVVNCAGAAANTVAGGLARLPMVSTTGALCFTPPLAARIGRIIATPRVSFRPDGGGRLMVHSGAADSLAAAGGETDLDALARGMAAQVQAVLPCAGGFAMEAVRVTQRPIPGDGYPAIGFWPGVENYYVAVSHSAVTLAPCLARMIAQELLGGSPDEDLRPYRPDRFWAA